MTTLLTVTLPYVLVSIPIFQSRRWSVMVPGARLEGGLVRTLPQTEIYWLGSS